MRSIDDLRSNTPESFSASNFGRAEYSDEQGKPRPMFILYRDGFMLLVMGYTGKKALAMKLAYIEAFNRMEEELARQKEAARNITQDIVDFPGSLSLTPSSVADRKPLRTLVGSWAKLSNAPFDASGTSSRQPSSSPASGTCRRSGYRTRWRGCSQDRRAAQGSAAATGAPALVPQRLFLPSAPQPEPRPRPAGGRAAGAGAGLDTARSRPPARVHGHAAGTGRPPRRPVQLCRVRPGPQYGYHVQPAMPAGQPVPEPHGSRATIPPGAG